MRVHLLPALETNYFFILEENGRAVVFDPGDAQPVISFLEKNSLNLEAIWITHHHWDHTDGMPDMLRWKSVPVVAPEHDLYRLSFKAKGLKEGDSVEFGSHSFKVIELPGHTLGSVAYFCKEQKLLFSADTLFSLGCGRLFEGSFEQMFKSLQKIKALPLDTKIYLSHEYTLKNFEFLKSVKDQFSFGFDLDELEEKITTRLKTEGKTVPSTLEFELKYNPFLNNDLETFTRLRQLRNQF